MGIIAPNTANALVQLLTGRFGRRRYSCVRTHRYLSPLPCMRGGSPQADAGAAAVKEEHYAVIKPAVGRQRIT